jgi:prevent-host-death family protein
MITASISEIKNDFSSFVTQARQEDVIVTNHGKPVAFIRGFEDDDDYTEHRLLNDPRFQQIVERAREDYQSGRVTKLSDIDD